VTAGRFGLGITNCRPAAEVVEGVVAAERAGAEIAFVAEDIGCRDAFALCALGAARTNRIRLSTGVVNPFTRHPMSLAMALATLDEISNGRAALGIGTSSISLIEDQLGMVMRPRVTAMSEAVTLVRQLLTGEAVSFEGVRFRFRDAHLDVRPVHAGIPIYFAAMGPNMLRLAGGMADGVLLNVGASPRFVRWAVAEVVRGAEAAGRDPAEITIAAWLTIYVTSDHEAGLRRARQWLAGMLSIPQQGELLLEGGGFDASILPAIRRIRGAYPHWGDVAAAGDLVPAEWAREMTLIGSADQVRDRLAEYRTAGVQVPVLGLPALRALYPST